MAEIKRQVELNAIFVIAFGFSVGLFLILFLSVWNSQKADDGLTESLQPRMNGSEFVEVELTPGEKRRLWFSAIRTLIQEKNKEELPSKAAYKFDACFMVGQDCVLNARAYRDEFEKTTFYFAPSSITDQTNHVSFYIQLQDGGVPRLMMRFVYFGENWAAIDNVVVLVGYQTVLDEKLPRSPGSQKALRGDLVYEFGDLMMNDATDVVELIAGAQDLAVRIGGESTFSYLKEDKIAVLKEQAKEILLMHKLIMEAVQGDVV